MYRFLGRSIAASGFGLDVPYVDAQQRHQTGNVQPKSPDCGSAKAVQQMLNDLGFSAGTVDGVFGKNTFGALSRFAATVGVAYAGTYPSANLCSALMTAWQTAKSAAQSVSPVGANIVAQAAVPAASVSPAQADNQLEQPVTYLPPPVATTPTGLIDKAKAWWASANTTKKAMVVGGVGLAVMLVAALSIKAPVAERAMTANRRKRSKRYACNSCGCKLPTSVGRMVPNASRGYRSASAKIRKMSTAELKRFADRLNRAGYKGDAYRLWTEAADELRRRTGVRPNPEPIARELAGRIRYSDVVPWTRDVSTRELLQTLSNISIPKRHIGSDYQVIREIRNELYRRGVPVVEPNTGRRGLRSNPSRGAADLIPGWIRVLPDWELIQIRSQMMAQIPRGRRPSEFPMIRGANAELKRRGLVVADELRRRGMRANARTCSRCGGVGYLTIPGHPHSHFDRWCDCSLGRMLESLALRKDAIRMGRAVPNAGRRSSGRCSPLKRRVQTCHCSPPAKYRRMGATRRSDYAFPECWMYPIRFRGPSGKVNVRATVKHIRAAASRFGKFARGYPSSTGARIYRRIQSAKRHYGIGR